MSNCPSCREPLDYPSGDGCAVMTKHKEKSMSDYSDWKVWKDVELYKEAEYLSENTEYQTETLLKVFEFLFEKGQKAGLEGCFLKFSSTREPYEDYLGPVQVTVCGYRKLNVREVKELEAEEAVRKLSEEMGIPFYEAQIVYSLKQRGKLK